MCRGIFVLYSISFFFSLFFFSIADAGDAATWDGTGGQEGGRGCRRAGCRTETGGRRKNRRGELRQAGDGGRRGGQGSKSGQRLANIAVPASTFASRCVNYEKSTNINIK